MRHATLSKLLSFAVLVAACSSVARSAPVATAPSAAEQSAAPPVSAGGREDVLADAALLLDVRNQDEYDRGHLDGAMLIPVAELEGRLGEVEAALAGDKSKKVVAYCGSGKRAGKAKQLLEEHGFSNVVNGGGYGALK